MDEIENWVAPVRLSLRRKEYIGVTPEEMGEDSEDPCFTIIWFDQGGTTGWAVFSIWPEAMVEPDTKILTNIAAWSAGEYTGTEGHQVDQMMSLVEAWGDNSVIGLEDFVLMRLGGPELLSPVRIGARFEDRLYRSGRLNRLVPPQTASLAMHKVTDERLKRWGFWNPLVGKQHARDAVKHAITYASRAKQANIKAAREEDRKEDED